MTQNELLQFSADVGHALMVSGAEIYRVEESLRRIFLAYDEPSGEVFALPHCLIVSMSGDGEPATRMRRAAASPIDIELLESMNALCRKLCAETPDYETAKLWLAEAKTVRRHHSFWGEMLGYVLGTSFFALFFGGNGWDAVFAAVAGILIFLTQKAMRRSGGSFFIRAFVGGGLAGATALAAAIFVPQCSMEYITIGAIMTLVPGITLTNGVRDIMVGDTVSGISKLCEALLIAAAIALGVGVALGAGLLAGVSTTGTGHGAESVPVALKSVYAALACAGYCILYNTRGMGLCICAFGGAVATAVYTLFAGSGSVMLATFVAAVAVSVYAESMARIRKCPVTAYQLVAMFPLVPGGGIYYTMSAVIDGDLDLAGALGVSTLGVAGMISLGLLVVSALVGMILMRKGQVKHG